MSLFELTHRHFLVLGIKSDDSTKERVYNFRRLFISLVFGTACVLTVSNAFVIRGSFEIYVNLFVSISTSIANAVDFAFVMWKTPKIFAFIRNLESHFQKGEYKFYLS